MKVCAGKFLSLHAQLPFFQISIFWNFLEFGLRKYRPQPAFLQPNRVLADFTIIFGVSEKIKKRHSESVPKNFAIAPLRRAPTTNSLKLVSRRLYENRFPKDQTAAEVHTVGAQVGKVPARKIGGYRP